VFAGALDGLNRVALAQTRVIQNGSLRRYIAIVLVTSVLAGLGMLLWRGGAELPAYEAPDVEVAAVAALIAVTSIAAALARSRLQAIAAMSAVGFGMALLFAIFSAPDVAMTQVLVDTLIVVLFVSVFRHLPTTMRMRSPLTTRLQVGAVAIVVGIAATILTWTVLTVPQAGDVSSYYVEASVPEAHGRNVVNTILVDFRALDTLGEITVLAVAALGIIAVLRLGPEDDAENRERS
jgi:multicomponent Na+:H+ antiporter subunit A